MRGVPSSVVGNVGVPFEDRIAWVGDPGPFAAENIIYESSDYLEVAVNIVNLDSWYQVSADIDSIIFNPNFKQIGVGACEHEIHGNMIVVTYAHSMESSNYAKEIL
jgi:hypothetical protein